MPNDERDILERFKQLDQQKKDTARKEEERIQKERQQRISNSAIVRFYDFARGNRNDYTDEELALLEQIDDPNLLDLDENGHLILKADTPEARARLEGKQNAQIWQALMQEEKAKKELSEEPTAEVLRIEDLDMTKARVFFAVEANEERNESSYAYVIDQGYGLYRSTYTGGEKLTEKSATEIAFYGLTGILQRFANAVQIFSNVTLFMDNELGWTIEQNSYTGTTISNMPEAENYQRAFRQCINRGIEICLAPSLGDSEQALLAMSSAKKLLKV